jgi:Ca2+-binding RTX toxin-like protein
VLRFLVLVLVVILAAAFAPAAGAATKRGVSTKVSKKTLTITGSKKADKIVVRVKRRAARTLEVDAGGSSRAEFSFARARFTKIVIRGGGGNDTITLDERNGVFTTSERTTLRGDAGNDRLSGGRGRESFDGGAGNDTFRSGPRDGNDTVAGGAGADRLIVTGSTGADTIAVAQGGARVRIARGTALAVTGSAVETLDIAPLAGADTLTLGDLRATSLARVGLDLARTAGGAAGDGAADRLVLNGSAAGDAITISGDGANAAVAGLGPAIAPTRIEPAADTLTVGGGAGGDRIDARALGAGGLKVGVDGGAGDDDVTGSANADTLAGGDGNDIVAGGGGNDALSGDGGNDAVSGGGGNDTATLGVGDDSFAWSAGDGTDGVDGGDGNDRVGAATTGEADAVDVVGDAGRVRIARGGEAVLADAVETAEVVPGGGADRVAVGDLRGTDAGQANVNFGDDGQPDELAVSGGAGDDAFAISSDGGATITGLGRITAAGGDGGGDKLVVATGAGNDTFDASGLAGGRFAVAVDTGEGADSVTTGGANDSVAAGPGDDTVAAAPGGSDTLDGGDGTDRLLARGSAEADELRATGSGARIQLFNGATQLADAGGFEDLDFQPLGGADRVTLEPGLAGAGITSADADLATDGSADVVTVSGSDAADNIPVTTDASGAHVRGVPVALDVAGGEAGDRIGVNALGGSDTVDGSTVAVGSIGVAIDGGDLADVLVGTPNADNVVGGGGNDVAFLRGGDDAFRWNPGDGNDTVEGQTGTDTLRFSGSDAAETFNVVANGGRVLVIRDVGAVTLDVDDVDAVDIDALRGADNVVVGDMTGTDLKKTSVDLAGVGAAGDGQADLVTVSGTNGDDTPAVASDASGVHATGLASAVDVTHFEPADRITINLLGGLDVYNASALDASIEHTINGGLGNDLIIGSDGDDTFNGGDGNDTGLLGEGDDTSVWNPGDDNDTIEGQTGNDRLLFNGANVAEEITGSANGGRVIFTRNIANVLIDLDDVERIDYNAFGGADLVTVNDLSGTDLERVVVDLAANSGGAGDAAVDTVVQNATNGDDIVQLDDSAGSVFTSGLETRVDVVRPEAANDRLTFNALAGDDVVEMSRVPAGILSLTADGGNDDDVLIGSDGADTLFGGAGDDVLIGGPATDVLDGGTGTNTVIQ